MENNTSCSAAGMCGVATLGLFCPLCLPAIAVFLSSLGLGFLATVVGSRFLTYTGVVAVVASGTVNLLLKRRSVTGHPNTRKN